MKKSYINWNIQRLKTWKECYEYFLDNANNFSIIFQGDPNDFGDDGSLLNIGKKEYLSLHNIKTIKYNGMENSFLVIGELTDEAKALFYKYMSPSFTGGRPELWSFEFLSDDDVLMRIDDKNHCIFNLTDNELKIISSMGITIDNSYDEPMISLRNVSLSENDIDDHVKLKDISKLIVENLIDQIRKTNK